ncbi:MAG: GDP-mannose 4,6-dehydratase, partial [Candidatus Bathyarchaeota archaeon]
QTRDFIHVEDVVEGNMLAINKEKAVGKVLNIATGRPATINQLAEKLQRIMCKTDIQPVYSDARLGDIEHSYADITAAEKFLQYRPRVSLDDGLARLIRFHSKSV